MNRTYLFVLSSGVTLAAVAAWLAWQPAAAVHKPHPQWQRTSKGYELVVTGVDARAPLPRGVVTTPSPVIRTIEFRQLAPPAYSSSALSSP
jgi:hypothetical protein